MSQKDPNENKITWGRYLSEMTTHKSSAEEKKENSFRSCKKSSIGSPRVLFCLITLPLSFYSSMYLYFKWLNYPEPCGENYIRFPRVSFFWGRCTGDLGVPASLPHPGRLLPLFSLADAQKSTAIETERKRTNFPKIGTRAPHGDMLHSSRIVLLYLFFNALIISFISFRTLHYFFSDY